MRADVFAWVVPQKKKKKSYPRPLRILRECEHPNVVRYYGSFLHLSKRELWIAMEYCGGGSVEVCSSNVFVCLCVCLCVCRADSGSLSKRRLRGMFFAVALSNGQLVDLCSQGMECCDHA